MLTLSLALALNLLLNKAITQKAANEVSFAAFCLLCCNPNKMYAKLYIMDIISTIMQDHATQGRM